ncbi:MAG: ATP-binding protein [Anaerolineae bacterium]|jgi:signal transduction histidine kinase
MMRTLRGRLILSHILPLLLIIPLVGVALVYVLETQVLLSSLSGELAQYGSFTADMASDYPVIWQDSGEAQQFVRLFSMRSQSHVMLLDGQGVLLASSEPGYQDQLGQALDLPNLAAALGGEPAVEVNYGLQVQREIVQVLVPVKGPDEQVLGVVRVSQYLADVQGQLNRLRRLILIAFAVELVLAVGLALVLALNLDRSLQRVTQAIYGVVRGQELERLPEEGPTEIRMLLEAFNTLIERLRVLEESRRRLLANLVHELGRPIGALQSAIHALLGGADEDVELREDLLEGMDAQLRRLTPLLDSLTDLHGQVLDPLELNREPVALIEWLQQTTSPWRQVAHDKGLHWQIEIPDSLPAVAIDADRMAQALGNLLSNAIKYTPDGTVSVKARVVDSGISIVVSDTGIGIAAAEQERIFEPFYRSNRDRRFPQGMGLGLSIARDLVVAHGGRLTVDSQPGQGSRFSIWLPILEQS